MWHLESVKSLVGDCDTILTQTLDAFTLHRRKLYRSDSASDSSKFRSGTRNMKKKWLFAFTAIVCFTPTPVLGQSKVLRVGAVGSPPFVIQGTKLSGIASDIWDEIARVQGLKFQRVISNNVPETIDAVAQNRLDIAIGPLSITSERLHKVAFTQTLFSGRYWSNAASRKAQFVAEVPSLL